jgi:T5SS/PEP-CTERM-associated repeat protein
LISGNDTGWEIGGELIVGDGGFGQVQVESGATLESGGARIGATELEGPGHVTVINPGSVWRSRGEIVIAGTGTNAGGGGATGQGILEVLDGALLEAPSMTLGVGGLLVGDSRIVLAGGTGTLINDGGVVAPGASPGRLSIDGNFTQLADGILTMEIAGPELFDQLAVSGLLTLGGTLNLAFIEDYSPIAGDDLVLEMFFSAATLGEFATVTTTGLAPGLHLVFDRGSFADGQSVSFMVAPVPLPTGVWMFAGGIALLVRKMHRVSSGS